MQVMDRTWLSVPIDLPMFLFLSLFLENMVSYVLELKGNPCGLGERRNINKVKNLDGFLSISRVLNLKLNLMRNQKSAM
jgi:hypothetical protein